MKFFIIIFFLFFNVNSLTFCQWEKLQNEIGSLNTTSIVATSDNQIFISAYGSGIYVSNDNGSNWEKYVLELNDFNIISLKVFKNFLFAGSRNNGLYICNLKNKIWKSFKKDLPDNPIWSIAADSNLICLGTRDSGIYISNDFGISWKKKNKDLIYIKCLELINDTLFAGTFNSGFHISPDKGNTWIERNNGLKDIDIRSIYFKNSQVYVGTSALGVFSSTDNGLNWNNINPNNEDFFSVWTIQMLEDDLILGCYGKGVYLAKKNSIFWKNVSDGLLDLGVFSSAMNDNYIFLLANSGIFRAKISDLKVTKIEDNLSENLNENLIVRGDFLEIDITKYNFYQNFSPNLISAYNSLGIKYEIKTSLLNDRKIIIDISEFSSGFFFVLIGDKYLKFIKI